MEVYSRDHIVRINYKNEIVYIGERSLGLAYMRRNENVGRFRS